VYDGAVVFKTKLNNSDLAKGIKEAKGSLGGLVNVAKRLGAAISVAFSIHAITNFAKTSVNAANELSNALTGLQSILDGQGRSFSSAQKFLEEYTSDGLVPMTNAVAAYKNLAMRGYDDSQIQQTLTALKDASAFGRQSSYTMGQAVQSATEGLKNENSVLVDNAGVTKNVAKMWEEYAASIGTTASNLTQEQKIQAEVNGILEETKHQTGDAAKVAGTFSGQVSQLSVNFNNLKVAVGNVVKPIVQSFLPAINAAVSAMTQLASSAATAMSLLLGSVSGGAADAATEIADGYQNAASGAEDLANGTEKAGKAAQKYLAGFDEITKIGTGDSLGNDKDAAGVETLVPTTVIADAAVQDEITPKIQAVVDKIMSMLEPLKGIDFSPAVEAFARLKEAAEPIGSTLFEGLEWLWNNILVPLAQWTIEDVIPDFLDLLSTALSVLNDVITALRPLGEWLWDSFLKPMAAWAAGAITRVLSDIKEDLSAIGKVLVQTWNTISWIVAKAWDAIAEVWDVAASWVNKKVLQPVADLFKDMWGRLKDGAADAWDGIKSVFGSVTTFFKNIFTNAWKGVVNVFSTAGTIFTNIKDGILSAFKKIVNGLIDGLNNVIATPFNGINTALEAIKKINILGLTPFSGLQMISVPQIPHLAQGAVLPANKPFMAMLGDQRHGTNIEAPLATIQEAVALVMDDMIQSNIAGHEATVAVLKDILEAVLGIHIGDDVIGQAAARYNSDMAIIRGR
jgi:hypothetical protein